MTVREFWRRPDEGDGTWLLGGLYTFKARGDETANAYSLFEVQGLVAAPRHLHEREEEGFYVVGGEVTLSIGDEMIQGTAGTFAFVPRGVEHAFTIESPEARLLLLLTPGNAGHEELFTEMGEPAAPNTAVPPPPSGQPDVERLAAIAARHGTIIVGPPGIDG
ncbi:MAG TPA: cupin domain-containing protein [Actinomycetota bacterium]|nr:cupin domain-containing protein [Actinomycetota bacterium]